MLRNVVLFEGANADGQSGLWETAALPDILLQNASSCDVAIWEMDGTSVTGGGAVSLSPGMDWQAIGEGGEGFSDILLQNANGQSAIWEMNGTAVTGGGLVSANAGPSWKAIGLT